VNEHSHARAAELQRGEMPRYIVVEGPIGAGKTTLAHRIAASLNYEVLLEKAEENPFLGRFYRKPREAALSAQLFFLLQRLQQIRELSQGDIFTPARVSDFMMERELLFAGVSVGREEMDLYRELHQRLVTDIPRPERVVYLQAPPAVLLKRVRARGRAMEQRIERDYLDKLNQAYSRFFMEYDQCPLLIVNAAQVDLVNNPEEYRRFLDLLLCADGGRHFINTRSLF